MKIFEHIHATFIQFYSTKKYPWAILNFGVLPKKKMGEHLYIFFS
jgi:hypothetical protein